MEKAGKTNHKVIEVIYSSEISTDLNLIHIQSRSVLKVQFCLVKV